MDEVAPSWVSEAREGHLRVKAGLLTLGHMRLGMQRVHQLGAQRHSPALLRATSSECGAVMRQQLDLLAKVRLL